MSRPILLFLTTTADQVRSPPLRFLAEAESSGGGETQGTELTVEDACNKILKSLPDIDNEDNKTNCIAYVRESGPALEKAIKDFSAFMEAATDGTLDTTKSLEQDSDFIKLTFNGTTLLIKAAEHGHVKLVKALLESGVEVDEQDEKGFTALAKAALHGHAKVAKALLEKEANVDEMSVNGTALMIAAWNGKLEVLEVLLSNNADVNLRTDTYTPLIAAVTSGNLEVVKMLLEKDAKVDEKDNLGMTALMHAAYYKYWSIAEALCAKKGDVNCLLDHGADANKKDKEGNTALEIEKKNRTDVVEVITAAPKPLIEIGDILAEPARAEVEEVKAAEIADTPCYAGCVARTILSLLRDLLLDMLTWARNIAHQLFQYLWYILNMS